MQLKTVDLGNGVELELVLISAGSFMMGSPASKRRDDDDEGPEHPVTLEANFWLGKYEVTQQQWAAVMGDNPSRFKGRNNPVDNVSWYDCKDFIKHLNQKFGGEPFRLPSEAEWEYACRAGGDADYSFSSKDEDLFGEGEAKLSEYAWFEDNARGRSQTVGLKKPNPWGLFDMHGNVWEWCEDWYGPYSARNQTNPTGATSGDCKVARGGGSDCDPENCRGAVRVSIAPGDRCSYVGLRLARSC